jgi:hypothetical protein
MAHPRCFKVSAQIKSAMSAFFIIVGLSACGGGGGSADSAGQPLTASTLEPQNISDPAAATRKLIISEVATNYYSNDVAWLEIHNAEDAPILLSDYKLRSSHTNPGTGEHSFDPIAFDLPAVTIPAKGYLLIAAGVYDKLQSNSQIVYVKNGAAVPYWNANGSVELVAAGQTVDFVRFGTSMALPLTASAWNGRNVDALPSGATEHGKSIVRLASRGMPDTNTASDWTLVNFASPAGMNDVGAGVIDSDFDGIPDSAKVRGGTYAGLDLYAMGARPGRRDIFIEIDYMTGTDPGIKPRREALQKVVDAFAEKNIAVHLDTGNLYSQEFDRDGFNLGGGDPVPFAQCIELVTSTVYAKSGCTSFYDYKSRHFDLRRTLLFHYALFANSQNLNGSAGSSGVAEIAGNDLIVTLGSYGFSTASASGLNLLINLQASTLMHELGHNLGLQHGGNESTNYKPNHYSVMNYMYQFAGLSATPFTANAAERYFLANGLRGKTYCNLVENSPCSSAFRISYSDGTSTDLNEGSLLEVANIGRGSGNGAYADWNDNHAFNADAYRHNLNPQDGNAISILKDHNEWGNLVLPFSRTYSGSNSGADSSDMLSSAEKKHPSRSNPMNIHARHRIIEQPLPEAFQQMLRKQHPGKP